MRKEKSEEPSLRKQEAQRVMERMKDTKQMIDQLSARLNADAGDMSPARLEELLAKYHSALHRYNIDEEYVKQLNSKVSFS